MARNDFETIREDTWKVFRYYLGEPVRSISSKTLYFNCHSCGKPKLGVTQEIGAAHCFVCGWSGTAITIIQEQENCTLRQAVLKGLDIIGTTPKVDLTQNKLYKNKTPMPDEFYATKTAIYLSIYSYLLRNLPKYHVEDITNLIIIKNNNNFTPDMGYLEEVDILQTGPLVNVAEHILKSYPREIVENCPGFVETNGNIWFYLNNHFIFPYWNSDRTSIVAFNGRRFEDGHGGPRYRWLIGERKHLYFPPGVNERNFSVITEGEKKAIVATAFGIPTIGVSGVECFNTEEMQSMRLVDRELYICYDREEENSQVRKAEARLRGLLVHKKASPKIVVLPDGYKLDDFLFEHGPDSFMDLMKVAK